MTLFTLQAQVDSKGNLSVSLPGEFQGKSVTVMVQVNPKDPIAGVRQTAGSIPDLERPSQVEIQWIHEQSKIQSMANTGTGGKDWERTMLYDRFDGKEEE